MKPFFDFLQFWQDWHGTWRFLSVLAVSLSVIYAAVWLLLRSLQKAAARTATRIDDEMLSVLRWPARLWTLMGALILAVRDLDERDVPKSLAEAMAGVIFALVLVSFTMAASRLTVILLEYNMRRSGTGQKVTTLTATLIRVLWLIPAVLAVLHMMKITLAPALTALGVGGLAVSLALKDTLANVFSGFYISMAGNIHKGDYIKLDSGQEGYVEDVRWRITSLRTLQNNLVVIPNSKLSEALVTNFSYPEKRMALPLQLGVDYSADIALVERVVLEEVQASAELDGLLLDPAPVVRFSPGFGASSLDLTLVVHVTEFVKQFAVQDELRRRLLLRFRAEGVNIPFPVRTLDLAPGSLKRALEG